MSQDNLGLFDTPPSRQLVRVSLALVGLLCAVLVILLALPNIRLRQIDAFIPIVDAIMFLGDLITATLLYVQATVFRSRALTVLASGYVLTGLLLIAHVLTFPGAFAPAGLLGAKVNTTSWISIFWRATPPIAIILYVVLRRPDSAAPTGTERSARIGAGLFAAIVLAAAITLLTTRGHDVLPQILLNRYDVNYTNLLRVNGVLIALFVLALALLFSTRKSVLDMWLLVALSGWLAHALLNVQGWGRFTVGFYSQFTLLLFSNLVVMLALIAESSWLFARLALSMMAQKHEQEARLMSMDAVAAAIAHEIKQPLTAMALNASAVLRWLDRTPIDPAAIAKPVRAIIDGSHRASDLIDSIRSVLARHSRQRTTFSLNGLVRETALLLDRELASGKVSLQLALNEALPPILADRVQLQQVLVNLCTNAIESLDATRGRPRRLAIRSVPLDGHDLLLEVSDNGIGIAPEKMEHIFDAFFTTKVTGTGLGLALCRTIVEEHGGHLWASQGEEHGATFHLQLPRSSLPAQDDVESY